MLFGKLSPLEAIAYCDTNATHDFECNICPDSIHDPVLTLCGHLYCWPCIYKWFHLNSASQNRTLCPICKSEISQSSLIPVYGRIQITTPSKDESHDVGIAIPPRPRNPVSVHDLLRSMRMSYNNTSTATQFYQPHYPYQTQQFNALDTTHGVVSQMIYARVFGNQLTSMYSSDSYDLVGNNNPRVRRHLMQMDKSLGRFGFFFFCCIVLCLLLF